MEPKDMEPKDVEPPSEVLLTGTHSPKDMEPPREGYDHFLSAYITKKRTGQHPSFSSN